MIKLILFTFFWTFFAKANECMETRAVFEIGSVNTKVKVAKFNTCTNRIEVINYQDTIKFSLNEKLTEEKQKIGINQILDFKKKAAEFNPSIYMGIASPVLADIPNGKSFIQKIKKECLIDFAIIDLKTQAYLGLAAVIHDSGLSAENLVVWDIGGSQMRMISKNKESGYLTYLGNKASVEFKNNIIKDIKKQNPKKNLSPNPIGEHNFKLALALARKWAKGVDPHLKIKLIEPNVRVIGIGGVHYSSVRPLTNPRSLKYTKAEVLSAIKRNLNKSDKNLQGEFRESQITNLILVLGYMEELNLELIETSKVDLTEGLLINPYLKF